MNNSHKISVPVIKKMKLKSHHDGKCIELLKKTHWDFTILFKFFLTFEKQCLALSVFPSIVTWNVVIQLVFSLKIKKKLGMDYYAIL